jgi:hypothetical protein
MTEEHQEPPSGAKRLTQRAINAVATLLGVGVMLAAFDILWEGGAFGSGLSLFIAGLVLLPFIPIPGRGSRVTLFILGLGFAIGLPAWDGYQTHKQSRAAVGSAMDAAVALVHASVKDGLWPEDLSGKLPDKLDVSGDGLSRDILVTECYQESCSLVVTFTDERYQQRLRDHSFVLQSGDGGKTWHCGPGGERPAIAADLPSSCRGDAN